MGVQPAIHIHAHGVRLFTPLAAIGLVASACLGLGRIAAGDEADDAAQKLFDATVTVRVVGARDFVTSDRGERQGEPSAPMPPENEVTVCSGTYIGESRVLSFGCLPVVEEGDTVKTEYRITLRAGGQATARPRVVDQHSGLVLLELAGHRPEDLTALALADEVPQTASAVLTAAAAGVELPLVSQGVLSGVDRTVAGTDLPPLLVCDISTMPSSSGAALVDMNARLIGIVAASSLPGENFGWTYAVPLKQIQRVLRAEEEGRLVVLPRTRPNLGVVLGPGEEVGAVVVQKVDAGGPGDRAGVVVGDQIVAIEGRVVRSVYQAGALLRKHLPGEQITLTCRSPFSFQAADDQRGAEPDAQEGDEPDRAESTQPEGTPLVRFVKVTLGEQSDSAARSLPVDVQPQAIKARFTTPAQIEVTNPARSYQFRLDASAGAAAATASGASPQKDELLQAQLQQYEELIQTLREETERQREALERREAMVESLLAALRQIRKEHGSDAEQPED